MGLITRLSCNLTNKTFNMKKVFLLVLSIFICCLSCDGPNPNIDDTGEDALKAKEMEGDINIDDQLFQDLIYVPIYSDIYVDHQNQKTLLAATLSIRNTSSVDSLFISKIDYYNTAGDLVRGYIENPISLSPMATINYVIEKEDDTGGPGANFIVEISSKQRDIKPLIQAVMIGEAGNKGFAFSTDGYSILN